MECLPAKIPEKIEVDVSDLEIGKSILVESIQLGADIDILSDAELSVFIVSAPMTEEELEELEAAAAQPEEAGPRIIGEEAEVEEIEEEAPAPAPEPEEEEPEETGKEK